MAARPPCRGLCHQEYARVKHDESHPDGDSLGRRLGRIRLGSLYDRRLPFWSQLTRHLRCVHGYSVGVRLPAQDRSENADSACGKVARSQSTWVMRSCTGRQTRHRGVVSRKPYFVQHRARLPWQIDRRLKPYSYRQHCWNGSSRRLAREILDFQTVDRSAAGMRYDT